MNLHRSADAVILEPAAPATASVIWLHGLGADGNDFVPLVPELHLPASLAVRFIFPHAPVRSIALNGNMRMRAWYDIPSLSDVTIQDEAGIRESEGIVNGYLQRELDAGIAPARIVLAGFSQGGAIALHTGLRHAQRLGGILALSTYLPLHTRLPGERSTANIDVPLLLCHGLYDQVLPVSWGRDSRDLLRGLGYHVEWNEYPMQHEVCAEEIERLALWLLQRLG